MTPGYPAVRPRPGMSPQMGYPVPMPMPMYYPPEMMGYQQPMMQGYPAWDAAQKAPEEEYTAESEQPETKTK
jgi:hypothetical protein